MINSESENKKVGFFYRCELYYCECPYCHEEDECTEDDQGSECTCPNCGKEFIIGNL